MLLFGCHPFTLPILSFLGSLLSDRTISVRAVNVSALALRDSHSGLHELSLASDIFIFRQLRAGWNRYASMPTRFQIIFLDGVICFPFFSFSLGFFLRQETVRGSKGCCEESGQGSATVPSVCPLPLWAQPLVLAPLVGQLAPVLGDSVMGPRWAIVTGGLNLFRT